MATTPYLPPPPAPNALASSFAPESEIAKTKLAKRVGLLSELARVGARLARPREGRGDGERLRGSSAKRGRVETILACLVDRDKDDNPTNRRLKFEKIRDGEEGRIIIPYRLKPVDWGVDEDGDPVTTCIVQWEFDRPQPPKRRAPQRPKTNITLDRAIKDVGLPADPDVLKKVFYKHHGGANHAANAAWHRAVDAEGLVLKGDGKLDYPP